MKEGAFGEFSIFLNCLFSDEVIFRKLGMTFSHVVFHMISSCIFVLAVLAFKSEILNVIVRFI